MLSYTGSVIKIKEKCCAILLDVSKFDDFSFENSSMTIDLVNKDTRKNVIPHVSFSDYFSGLVATGKYPSLGIYQKGFIAIPLSLTGNVELTEDVYYEVNFAFDGFNTATQSINYQLYDSGRPIFVYKETLKSDYKDRVFDVNGVDSVVLKRSEIKQATLLAGDKSVLVDENELFYSQFVGRSFDAQFVDVFSNCLALNLTYVNQLTLHRDSQNDLEILKFSL